MPGNVSVRDLKEMLATQGDVVALIDVRETAEYNLAHIAGSCSVPRRQIEWRMLQLVPWTGTTLVVCDDDGRRAALAAGTLEAMGYTDVSVLNGGLNRWVTDGETTEWGVNVPSKDFGEKVLLQNRVPEVEPDELASWLAHGRRLVMLDSRTPEEHARACIPGSRSMPGAELGLRAWDIAPDDGSPIVVHCAGRTRSIIGAGTLQRLGFKNVFALKNGTMGWQLAGLEVETGSGRLALPEPSADGAARAEAAARQVATEDGVSFVDVEACRALMERGDSENVYLIDVRSREEYAAGHIPGFRWVPGGQAVQATDNFVAVRGGTLVFACDGVVRAAMTASWFRQMGFPNACVLDGGTRTWQDAGLALEAGLDDPAPFGLAEAAKRVKTLSADALREQLAAGGHQVIHAGTSDEFSAAHVPGSRWVPRSWLELRVAEIAGPATPVVVTDADGVASLLAAATLLDMGYADVSALEGGVDAWRKAGGAIEQGLAGVTQAPDDVLPARRSYAEMLNYLRWEEELGEKYRG